VTLFLFNKNFFYLFILFLHSTRSSLAKMI